MSVASYCFKLLWVKYQLEDYFNIRKNISIYCDNTNAINLSKNSIQHPKIKHIEERYSFMISSKKKYLN